MIGAGGEQDVRMGVFYRSLPMLAGQSKGFFARHGLSVDYQQVTSSTQQFEWLRDDRYDMVQTSPDNVVNYRLNKGNPLGERIQSVGFMGMDYGMYLVVTARPGIGSVGDLRGKKLAVDALASGFAYVLYKILRRAGLERDVDYDVVPIGGVADRYAALLRGEFDATLLSGGFETRAANQGYALLDSVYDIAPSYLGVMAVAKDSWLREHREAAIALIRAYREATRWCLDPSNHDEAVELLVSLPNTDRQLAEQLYEVQLRPGVGIVPDAGIEPAAMAPVMALREEFGGFEESQDVDLLARPEGGVYSLEYLEAALGAE